MQDNVSSVFFLIIANLIFSFALAFYFITALQWFSYKINRVLFHFTKPKWHFFYAFLPFLVFIALGYYNSFLALLFSALYAGLIYYWHTKNDKKLVFTKRIWTFFIALAVCLLLALIYSPLYYGAFFYTLCFVFAILVAVLITNLIEKVKFIKFKLEARKKIDSMQNLTIIQITASFGKTSIKNFLYEILSDDFVCYKTPRSVNTLAGLVKDVNENLNSKTQIYIAEAGAREKGDILAITKFLKPKIVVIGEIGEQHIEYFKTLENIRATKLEALKSKELSHAFVHSSTGIQKSDNVTIYDKKVFNIVSTLNGIEFMVKGFDYRFISRILGSFNAQNLGACIEVAKFLGLDFSRIAQKIQNLKSVEHRLEIVENPNKLIIDDGFNGNLKGMIASYELCDQYNSRKVVVTPGIVESTKKDNEILAQKIEEIFDLVIVTSALNREIFKKIISKNKLIILDDKSKLVDALAKNTSNGDLILFSNDAPSFV